MRAHGVRLKNFKLEGILQSELDAATGRVFWVYPYIPSPLARLCCGRVNRGLAILGQTLFMGTIDDWPEHLAKITEFWSLQTGGPSRYRGGFGTAHLPLELKPEHFQHWLNLWEFNNARALPPPCASPRSSYRR